MAIEQKIVCICDVCGYMVEAKGSTIDAATAPDNWGHGKLGRIDLCPRCVKRVEHINDKIEREQRSRKVNYYDNKREV